MSSITSNGFTDFWWEPGQIFSSVRLFPLEEQFREPWTWTVHFNQKTLDKSGKFSPCASACLNPLHSLSQATLNHSLTLRDLKSSNYIHFTITLISVQFSWKAPGLQRCPSHFLAKKGFTTNSNYKQKGKQIIINTTHKETTKLEIKSRRSCIYTPGTKWWTESNTNLFGYS